MASLKTLRRMRAYGIVNPVWTARAAERAGVQLSLACAFLGEESGGGHNVFGHDPTIYRGAGRVTRAKYLAYRRQREASGNREMQGVGPMQLTWYAFQDEADRRGGCWRPYPNILTGLLRAAELIREHGEAAGIAAYNGAGAAAETYSRQVRARRDAWHHLLTRP